MPMSKEGSESLSKRSRFRIGAIEVHPDRYVVIRDGVEINLAPRTMDLLVELADANNKTVTREKLLEKVWKNPYLDDNPVNKAMCELREKLGDDRAAPTYIKTIRGSGYRIIPPIEFSKGYRRRQVHRPFWSGGNPYVGLAAFDRSHAEVFFGRDSMGETLLRAMRSQLDNGRRLVLLHGASGSGKTSLLRARIIPKLTEQSESDDLHALAVAHCDLASAKSGDVVSALASALASWSLDGCPVFPPQPIEELTKLLIETPEAIEGIVDDAFRQFPDRKTAEHPLSHLLLVIDHTEKLVDTSPSDSAEHDRFTRAINALCDSEHTLTTMIVRGDFYLKLLEALPDLMERKGSDGHIDVLRPQRGEIAEIIRSPAECADLDFEQGPEHDGYLDDKLIEDSQGKPDVLPLLQHTLEQLYENRDKATGTLTYAAYRAMGGLEGAIAHRAEAVFTALPPEAQQSLDCVLSQLIVNQLDSEVVSGGHPFMDTLDSNAQVFVQAFINARLFASELRDNRPKFCATHEALLRQWPRAVDWAKENRRLLQAKAHFKITASRWNKENRNPDHLLNPGRPLSDAIEATNKLPGDLEDYECDFLEASGRLSARRRLFRRGSISMLAILTLISITMASIARIAQEKSNIGQEETKSFAYYIIGEVAKKVDPSGNLSLLESIGEKAISHYGTKTNADMNSADFINYASALRILGETKRSQGEKKQAAYYYALSAEKSGTAISLDKNSSDAWYELSQAIYYLGLLEFESKQYEEADKKWLAYLRISRNFTAASQSDPRWLMEESYALNNLGSSALRRGEADIALRYFIKSTDLKSKIVNIDQNNMENIYAWIDSKSWISSAMEANGDFAGASKGYDVAIGDLKKLISEKENANTWKFQTAKYLLLSANVEMRLSNFEKAEKNSAEAVALLSNLSNLEPNNEEWRRYLSRAQEIHTHANSGHPQESTSLSK